MSEEPPAIEIEVQVPCVEGKRHAVRLRLLSWSEWQIVYNPCAELLGAAFGLMAECSHYVRRREKRLCLEVIDRVSLLGSSSARVLEGAMQDADLEVQRTACQAAAVLGEACLAPALSQALAHRDQQVRHWARLGLEHLGKAAAPAVATMLESPAWWARKAACILLGKYRAPETAAQLIPALFDSNSDVRHEAQRALINIGEGALEPLHQARAQAPIGQRRTIQAVIDAIMRRSINRSKTI